MPPLSIRLLRVAAWIFYALSVIPCAVFAQGVAVTTYHNDNKRTGWNSAETVLTPTNVNTTSFGLLQTVTLDEQVDAQVLVVPGVNITAGSLPGIHDVAYVATENNTVYAIDVHSGAILLSPNFGKAVAKPLGCGENGPNVGITSTPVIDLPNNVLYVVTYTSPGPVYKMHELSLGSLTDVVTPGTVSATHELSGGSTISFQAKYQRQRPALLLSNGNVYAAFGSFCDNRPEITRGWLIGWETGSLTQLEDNSVFDMQATSPSNYFMSSVWMSGYGPAADDDGNIFLVTGNSDPAGSTYDGATNLQESALKISDDTSQVRDLFTPVNQASLDMLDTDFGSGGILLIPDQPGSAPHMAVAAGKNGSMYLLNRDSMGGYGGGGIDNVLGTYAIGGCYCGQSYYLGSDGAGRVVTSGGRTAQLWKINTSPSTTLTHQYTSKNIGGGQGPGFFTSISSNGTTNQIVWTLSHALTRANPTINLYALNPNSKMTTIFSSAAGSWPNTGGNANLVPTVANGQVFVATNKQLQIFGLKTSKRATRR